MATFIDFMKTCLNVILELQSISIGSNIFGTMEICSRHGYFEPLRVNSFMPSVLQKGHWQTV